MSRSPVPQVPPIPIKPRDPELRTYLEALARFQKRAGFPSYPQTLSPLLPQPSSFLKEQFKISPWSITHSRPPLASGFVEYTNGHFFWTTTHSQLTLYRFPTHPHSDATPSFFATVPISRPVVIVFTLPPETAKPHKIESLIVTHEKSITHVLFRDTFVSKIEQIPMNYAITSIVSNLSDPSAPFFPVGCIDGKIRYLNPDLHLCDPLAADLNPLPLPICQMVVTRTPTDWFLYALHRTRPSQSGISVYRKPSREAQWAFCDKDANTGNVLSLIAEEHIGCGTALALRRNGELTLFSVISGALCWTTPDDYHPLRLKSADRTTYRLPPGSKLSRASGLKNAYIVPGNQGSACGGETDKDVVFLAINPDVFPRTGSPSADLALLFSPGISSAAVEEVLMPITADRRSFLSGTVYDAWSLAGHFPLVGRLFAPPPEPDVVLGVEVEVKEEQPKPGVLIALSTLPLSLRRIGLPDATGFLPALTASVDEVRAAAWAREGLLGYVDSTFNVMSKTPMRQRLPGVERLVVVHTGQEAVYTVIDLPGTVLAFAASKRKLRVVTELGFALTVGLQAPPLWRLAVELAPFVNRPYAGAIDAVQNLLEGKLENPEKEVVAIAKAVIALQRAGIENLPAGPVVIGDLFDPEKYENFKAEVEQQQAMGLRVVGSMGQRGQSLSSMIHLKSLSEQEAGDNAWVGRVWEAFQQAVTKRTDEAIEALKKILRIGRREKGDSQEEIEKERLWQMYPAILSKLSEYILEQENVDVERLYDLHEEIADFLKGQNDGARLRKE